MLLIGDGGCGDDGAGGSRAGSDGGGCEGGCKANGLTGGHEAYEDGGDLHD